MSKPQTITIEFASEEAALHFADWLCGSGEQQYWDWMRYREEEEDGDITALDFDYWGKNKRSKFMSDWTIRTKLGRLGAE